MERFILIMLRHLMYLHYILNEESASLLRRFFDAQRKKPSKNDWTLTVFNDLEYLEIYLDLEQIREASKDQFKTLVEKSIETKCFEYLLEEKNKLKKVSHIIYKKFETQKYLLPSSLTPTEAKFIFLLKNRMLETKDNFRNKFDDDNCPLCDDQTTKDSQEHILVCPSLQQQCVADQLPNYNDLFNGEIAQQLGVATIISENFKKRKKILQKKIWAQKDGCKSMKK